MCILRCLKHLHKKFNLAPLWWEIPAPSAPPQTPPTAHLPYFKISTRSVLPKTKSDFLLNQFTLAKHYRINVKN